MILIINERVYKNAEELKKTTSSKKMLEQSLSEFLLIDKASCGRKILFIVLELTIAIYIATQIDTVIIVRNILGVFTNTVLAVTAIIFTGYVFFQALVNDTLLISMLAVESDEKRVPEKKGTGKKKGNLTNTNAYFCKLIIFFIFLIFVDLVGHILLTIVPDDLCLFSIPYLNEIISSGVITMLLYCHFEGIWELKSFVFNVYVLINLHAYSRIAELKEEEKQKEEL